MSATITPRAFRRSVEEIEEEGTELRVRYRWGEGENDVDFARSRKEPIERAILEDRWCGLLHRNGDASKLQARLDGLLYDLSAGLTRRDRSASESALIDGEIVDVDMHMEIDGLEEVIRDWLIERAEAVAL